MDLSSLLSLKRPPPKPLFYSVTSFAPGRANLIGEHTDYNGGLCLPFALELGITCTITLQRIEALKQVALEMSSEGVQLDSLSYDRIVFYLRECQALQSKEQTEFGEVVSSMLPKGPAAFIAGSICWYFNQEKVLAAHANILLAILEGELLTKVELRSTLPQGAGLSSSAALCMSILIGLNDICDNCLETLELCQIAMQVEHTFLGTKCGLMDQMAIAFSKENHFLEIDFSDVIESHLPWKNSGIKHELTKANNAFNSYIPVLFNTGVSHNLAETQYNLRRSQCEQALDLLKDPFEEIAQFLPAKLGAFSFRGWESLLLLLDGPDALEKDSKITQANLSSLLETFFFQKCKQESAHAKVLAKRAAHAIFENRRVAAASSALKIGVVDTLHKALLDSHVSLDVDYQVSCRELNLAALYLFQAAQACPPQNLPKILGPRMTGGGFGGSIVALVHKDIQNSITETFQHAENPYTLATGLRPNLIWSTLCNGARILSRN